MIASYLKISIAVLKRRKFLTFVNLFGTVLTLSTLVTGFAVLESMLSPDGAQRRQAHILAVDGLGLIGENQANRGRPGWAFYERYIEPMQSPGKTSFATAGAPGTSYVDGREITSVLRRTDAAYWEILAFDVLEGRTIAPDDVDRGRFAAVINQATAGRFFPGRPALGETIVVNQQSFEIIGVVANEPETSRLAYADIWVPLTTAESEDYRKRWLADGSVMLYVEDPARRRAVQNEYRDLMRGFEYSIDPDLYHTALSSADTALDSVAARFLGRENGSVQTGKFVGAAVLVALLAMLLPAINMANLNVGRILERASEIGLRKATGASTRTLVGQLVFENVVLVSVGGLLAFAIAPVLLAFLNRTYFAYGTLGLNLPVFVAGLLFVVLFGVLSGAYPGWRMARLEPAAALRGLGNA